MEIQTQTEYINFDFFCIIYEHSIRLLMKQGYEIPSKLLKDVDVFIAKKDSDPKKILDQSIINEYKNIINPHYRFFMSEKYFSIYGERLLDPENPISEEKEYYIIVIIKYINKIKELNHVITKSISNSGYPKDGKFNILIFKNSLSNSVLNSLSESGISKIKTPFLEDPNIEKEDENKSKTITELQLINKLFINKYLFLFDYFHIMYNHEQHILGSSKTYICSKKDVSFLKKLQNIGISNFSTIKRDDPTILWLGAKINDIICIVEDSLVCGEYTVYKKVTN